MNKQNKKRNRGFGFYVIVFLVLLGTVGVLLQQNGGLLGGGSDSKKTVTDASYSDIQQYFFDEKVEEFTVKGTDLTMTLKDGTTVYYTLASADQLREDLGELIETQKKDGVLKKYNYEAVSTSIFEVMLPWLIILGAMMVFYYFVIIKRSGGGGAGGPGNFGKSKAKMANPAADSKRVTFDDVAGADEEKADLQEIVGFLKDPKRFIALGARIPKGVLLVGPPGTGKTLIAKAVAGEAGVPFFSISGSDFVELYVGVGASRVRDLFDQAKKHAPAIVFIDEIDAVGRQRGTGLGGGHDEREQTLNQLLVEMDGFGNNAGVIVVAATNRVDILDPALLRPGRFDRQIYIGVPDIKGRVDILKVHAQKKPFEDNVSFENIARSTVGFTGAGLENLLNEAALLAARRGKEKIGLREIDDAFLKVIMGNEKKSRVITEHERKITAYHEGGHAITSRLLPTQDPVQQVSIIPRGRAGGFTLNMPKEDKNYASKNEMLDEIVVLLAGRVAEKIKLDDISTGASNDIERASKLARSMVTKYGMSDRMGPICYGADHDEVFLGRDFASSRTISEETAAAIDKEVREIIEDAYVRCEQLLRDNDALLDHVAGFLLKNETMDNAQLEAIFRGEEPVVEVTEPAEQEPSQAAETTLQSEASGDEAVPDGAAPVEITVEGTPEPEDRN